MALYKVLLVDDEEDVRQSIVKKLDWAALGFEVAGEAGNGQEALEKAELLAPDVVMTDIKMPFMDGLELCRRVKALLPGVRVAIFSGFDEFEYAKEAIAQQVEEYILKPINAQELAGVFARLRQTLDDEFAARRDMERLRRYYDDSLPQLRGHFLAELLAGRVSGLELHQKAADYGLDLAAAGYCAAIVRASYPEDDRDNARLMEVSLRQLLSDTLEGGPVFHLVPGSQSTQLLFLLKDGQDMRTAMAHLERLFPLARRFLGVGLSIGVGGAYPAAEDIPLSAEEAARALDYQILVERDQCIYIGDIEPGNPGEPVDPAGFDEILRQIKIGHSEDLRAAIDRHMAELKRGNTGIDNFQIHLMELVTELLRLIRTYRLDPEEAGQAKLISGHLYRAANLDELGQWLFDGCDNLRRMIRRERKDSSRLLVDRARELIDERYADSELSLDTVCGQLNVSPAYFSSLFKRETGHGFVNYLTALRMDKALALLATTTDKTYQIAEKVGYMDPNYFSYVFKKQFGVSPSKYNQAK